MLPKSIKVLVLIVQIASAVNKTFNLEGTSILYGILKENTFTSDLCGKESSIALSGVQAREIWAIKAIDASGQLPTSFIWGNLRWLGSKEHCEYLNDPPLILESGEAHLNRHENLVSSVSPFTVDYRMIFANFTSNMFIDPLTYAKPIIQIGICVPSSCDDHRIKTSASHYLHNQSLMLQHLYNVQIEEVNVRGTSVYLFLRTGEVLKIISVLVIVFCLSTAFSVLSSMFNPPECDHEFKSRLQRFVLCFSISRNLKSLYSAPPKSTSLASINGLRVFTCLIVMTLHVSYCTWFTHNTFSTGVLISYTKVLNQPFLNGALWTDTFFVIGGLLLVYNFLHNEKRFKAVKDGSFWENSKLFGKMVLHRYFRYIPVFLLVMAITHLVGVYLRDVSMAYVDEDYSFTFSRPKFWRNLLLIQNFYDVKEVFVSWCWYLACDFQYYVVFLLLLFFYAKHKWIAMIIFFASAFGLTMYSFAEHLKIKVVSVDQYQVMEYHLYTRPWFRVLPYYTGIFFGWIMYQLQEIKFALHKAFVVFLWCLSVFYAFQATYITCRRFYIEEYVPHIIAVALSFGKIGFGGALAIMIGLCFLGYGEKINQICSRKSLVHLGKITFTFYILHPALLILAYGARDGATLFDYMMVFEYIGFAVTSYVLAVVCAVIIEIPCSNLSEEFLLNRRPKQIASRFYT